MTRLILASLLSIILCTGQLHAAETVAPDAPVYERHIRPILKAHCFQCHGESGETEGGLDVRLRRLIIEGGDSGAAIMPGKPQESHLLARIVDKEMPPGESKLTATEIATIERWIATGAKTARAEPDSIDGPIITQEERNFWSFQPIERPPVPQVKHAELVSTPIDAFLLQKLEAQGFSFSQPADRRTLIRRVTFDLTGLPPTPEAVAAFVADKSPLAYEKLLDRLLESPQYGERWARHWLDVAGYADSEGYTEQDLVRGLAYKYRDYVIRAFNADKPLDEFIQEQLAGDELVGAPYTNLTAADVEKLIATGFLRMAPDGTATADIDQVIARNQVVSKSIQIVSTSLLGMTVGCAECHDHRYDPIPQTDYTQFRAIFEPAFNLEQWRVPNARRISLLNDADRAKSAKLEAEARALELQRREEQVAFIKQAFEKELAKLPAEVQEDFRKAYDTVEKERTPAQIELIKKHASANITGRNINTYDEKKYKELLKLTAEATRLRKLKPTLEYVRAMAELPGTTPETHLFFRGDPNQPRQALLPAELTVLHRESKARLLPVNDESMPTTGRRLAFARRITSGAHPLTTRVLANRIWLHHFGRGIVSTPGDFGALGSRPSHPELLDWLATELVAGDWKLKRFHKLLMTSTAYRQQIRVDAKQDEVDPDNALLGGMRLSRLEAEVVRDAILSISGKLNLQLFGEPVPVMADPVGQFVIGIENQNAGRPGAIIAMKEKAYRRSIYVQARRSRPLAMLDTFDLPRMDPNCEVRASSTVAPQSLMLMNNLFVLEQAEHFANRVQADAGEGSAEQVKLAWNLALQRDPTEVEAKEALALLRQQTEYFTASQANRKRNKRLDKNLYQPGLLAPPLQSLASLCQILLSSNEFLYVD